MAFGFAVSAAWRMNIDNPNRNFMTYDARLNVTHRIDDDGKFVFATKIQECILITVILNFSRVLT